LNQNFFDLGGDSLLAMQLIGRIRQQFDVDVPIRGLFETPTIEGLVRLIKVARENGAAPRRSKIAPPPKPSLDALAAELGNSRLSRLNSYRARCVGLNRPKRLGQTEVRGTDCRFVVTTKAEPTSRPSGLTIRKYFRCPGVADTPGVCRGGGPKGCRMKPGSSPSGRTKAEGPSQQSYSHLLAGANRGRIKAH
jgi:aryl carrier-like protein